MASRSRRPPQPVIPIPASPPPPPTPTPLPPPTPPPPTGGGGGARRATLCEGPPHQPAGGSPLTWGPERASGPRPPPQPVIRIPACPLQRPIPTPWRLLTRPATSPPIRQVRASR